MRARLLVAMCGVACAAACALIAPVDDHAAADAGGALEDVAGDQAADSVTHDATDDVTASGDAIAEDVSTRVDAGPPCALRDASRPDGTSLFCEDFDDDAGVQLSRWIAVGTSSPSRRGTRRPTRCGPRPTRPTRPRR